MSSEIYELMKRSDEAHVVEKAHRRPRFVEDCVREMMRGVIEQLPGLSTTGRSCRRARSTSRRSTSTTWSPSASARSVRSATSCAPGVPAGAHRACSAWLSADPVGEPGHQSWGWSDQRHAGDGARAPRPAAEGGDASPTPSPGAGQLLLTVARARSAGPTCTCATPRSRRTKLPVVLGHQIVGRTEDGRRVGVPWLGWTDGDLPLLHERPGEPVRQRPLHRPRHRRRLRPADRRRRALLPRRCPTSCPTSRPRRCCAAG